MKSIQQVRKEVVKSGEDFGIDIMKTKFKTDFKNEDVITSMAKHHNLRCRFVTGGWEVELFGAPRDLARFVKKCVNFQSPIEWVREQVMVVRSCVPGGELSEWRKYEW